MSEILDVDTGEILSDDLDPKVRVVTGKRSDGSTFYALDYTGCPSRTEPHHYNETNINYLVEKFKPDELVAYLQARNPNRQAQFRDFTIEPTLQEAKNIHYKLGQAFEKLPDHVRGHFGSVLNYLKFIDNPDNIPALEKLGLIEKVITSENKTPNQNQQNSQVQQKQTETHAPHGAT